ncbi:MAG: RNA 2',3'-cyclic phosphodiesterase [Chlorobiaceae bacterium]|nr:RNA 2',3'-cyclic phosphodiesterase [Chlorobiaceae bacterium]
MGRTRVFVGLPAGRSLQDEVAGFRRSHGALKVRWTRPVNLHVTMVAPWALLEPAPVCRALEGFASTMAAVPVRFDAVSAGPDPHRPRLLWATGTAPESICTLAARLNAALGDGRESSRGFLLHLTIARLHRQDACSGAVMKLRETVCWEALFDTICLYESILKPTGAEYRELCRFPLLDPFKK